MSLKELLFLIAKLAKQNNLSEPKIVGGTPRDKLLGIVNDINDLDITTGDEGSLLLSKELAKNIPGSFYKNFSDGHSQVLINNFKVDFSSNFKIKDLKEPLGEAGIFNPSEMHLELYSRDFTCNSLLMSLDLKKIEDPTGLGITDIKRKLLRTNLPAWITLRAQRNRVTRIVYLSAKLDFDIDKEIIDWVSKHPQQILDSKPRYIVEKLKLALNFNPKRALHALDVLNLWNHIPMFPELIKYVKGPKRI